MTHNNYIYIAVMALVSYAIRILPLTLIRKPIKTALFSRFVLCALCDPGRDDLSGYHSGNAEPGSGSRCVGGGHCCRMVWRKPVSGGCGLLCSGVRVGIFI